MIKTNKEAERMLLSFINAEAFVAVGVLGVEPKKFKDSKNRTKTSFAVSNVEVAAIHEFGAPRVKISERSFLRSTALAKENDWFGVVARRIKQQLAGNKFDEKQVLNYLGNIMVGDVKDTFTNPANRARGPWADIDQSTKDARLRRFTSRYQARIQQNAARRAAAGKATFRPLIDTGQLRASITFEVVEQ